MSAASISEIISSAILLVRFRVHVLGGIY